MIIGIDFDGTIVPDCYPGSPTSFLPGAEETLWALRNAGHILVLWTLRDAGTNGIAKNNQITEPLFKALRFLEDNGLNFLLLPRDVFGHNHPPLPKLPFDLFIDDKIPGGFPGWDFIRRALLPDHQSGVNVPGRPVESQRSGHAVPESVDPRAQQLNEQRIESVQGVEGLVEKAIPGFSGFVESQGNSQESKPLGIYCGMPLHGVCQTIPTQNDQGLGCQSVHRCWVNPSEIKALELLESPDLSPNRPRCSAHPRAGNDFQRSSHVDHLGGDLRQTTQES